MIKFNGQGFTVDEGKGPDYRDWADAYWWQNTRQPYYNALQQGDLDTMRSFLDFYLRMLPYVNARTKAQFKGLAAAATKAGSKGMIVKASDTTAIEEAFNKIAQSMVATGGAT